jgi:predicted nucleotidyltransferase component of viral defense system
MGMIKTTKTPFSIDFGFGDVVVPKPITRRLPVQLIGFDAPEVLTYSLESTVAEKFDAILSRMELTSRMKDFFDIYYLATMFDFEGRKLQEAIQQTLDNRQTNFTRKSLERISQFHSNKDMVLKWNLFSKKSINISLEFSDVIRMITILLNAPFSAILNESECFEIWNKDESSWIKQIQ